MKWQNTSNYILVNPGKGFAADQPSAPSPSIPTNQPLPSPLPALTLTLPVLIPSLVALTITWRALTITWRCTQPSSSVS
ncbi:hypothetical protein E2C01_080562 [Portunus trituberculatus]|uniref:Uncharacterized protein n=1 Tax=Portunus trituberculatus TaxID=210409 RepID=A0A5B7IMJ0_PORTR|nr:hypothetical protein [Portunus trituberculatus]